MKDSFKEMLENIVQRMDAIYLINVNADTYTMAKDKPLFHLVFGDKGSYSEMVEKILENMVDKRVCKGTTYGVFVEKLGKFKGHITNNAKIRIGDRIVTVSLSAFPVDEVQTALVINEIENEEPVQELQAMLRTNDVVKSAYLFTMNINLVTNKCQNYTMSEVENIPSVTPEIFYTDWRDTIVNMFPKEDQEVFLNISDPEYLRRHLHYGRTKSAECQMMNLEGQYIWVRLIFNRINTGNDNDFRAVFMVENIQESHVKMLEEMKKYGYLATVDSLTQILNRGRIELEIVTGIERCRVNQRKASLIMFDIDHFKQVNDTYGHAAGDYVIKTIASIASSHMNLNLGKLGRWGGEEFMGMLEDTSGEKAAEIAEEIRIKIAEYPFEIVDSITSSFGVIEVAPEESAEDAFRRVDAMVYQAKARGRNRVVSI